MSKITGIEEIEKEMTMGEFFTYSARGLVIVVMMPLAIICLPFFLVYKMFDREKKK